jgi:hypothetical protein
MSSWKVASSKSIALKFEKDMERAAKNEQDKSSMSETIMQCGGKLVAKSRNQQKREALL